MIDDHNVQKILSRMAVIASAVTTLIVFNAGTSFAAQDAHAYCEKTYSSSDGYSKSACLGVFESEMGDGTEGLTLMDLSGDGHSVVVVNYRYDLENIGPYYGTVTTGNTTQKQWILHMPEGTMIRFKVCAAEGGSILSSTCSPYVTGIA
jgi:uncharacterized membrane protein